MPRIGKATTVYLDHEPYQKLKKLLKARFDKPISQEINEFIIRRVAELEGTQVEVDADEYEALKRKHSRLMKDAGSIEKNLMGRGVYDRLRQIVFDFGLDFTDLHNADEVSPKLLKEWDGPPAHAHQFITLLETVREMKKVERRLEEVRNAKKDTVK